jgi:hypothetical protein
MVQNYVAEEEMKSQGCATPAGGRARPQLNATLERRRSITEHENSESISTPSSTKGTILAMGL